MLVLLERLPVGNLSRNMLVALGDSITNGGGGMALGVYPRSWAHWLALALDVPYHGLASDGATADDVLREQVPRLRERYAVGCLYVGVNDVRAIGFDAGAFARAHRAATEALLTRRERVLTPTIPLDLGRPRAGAKVADANAAIRASGATVVELEDLRGWRHVLPDAVHPHAVGQLEIADRAARALGITTPPTPLPSSLRDRETGARAEARWARAYARLWVGDVVRRVREGGLRGLQRG
jgi:lysophospholipase L1-like esterase